MKNKFFKKEKTTKVCPRCGEKTFIQAKKCDYCNLSYAKLEEATNKEAKKAILTRDNDRVVYIRGIPKDVGYVKLILFSLFLGLFGVHNFYIGRYVKSIISFVFTMFLSIMILLDSTLLAKILENGLFIVGCFVFYWYIFDFIQIVFKKYKIPVAIKKEISEVKVISDGEEK